MYGFFERSINRFTSTGTSTSKSTSKSTGTSTGKGTSKGKGVYNTFATLADRVLGRRANADGQVVDLRNGVDETGSEVSVLKEDDRLESSDSEDELTFGPTLEPALEPTIEPTIEPTLEPTLVPAVVSSEEDEKTRGFIQTKLRGTKLFYFMRRNKEMWI